MRQSVMNSRLRGSLNLQREITNNNLTCCVSLAPVSVSFAPVSVSLAPVSVSLAAVISTNITTRYSSHIINTPWYWYWYTGQRWNYLNNKSGYHRRQGLKSFRANPLVCPVSTCVINRRAHHL